MTANHSFISSCKDCTKSNKNYLRKQLQKIVFKTLQIKCAESVLKYFGLFLRTFGNSQFSSESFIHLLDEMCC